MYVCVVCVCLSVPLSLSYTHSVATNRRDLSLHRTSYYHSGPQEGQLPNKGKPRHHRVMRVQPGAAMPLPQQADSSREGFRWCSVPTACCPPEIQEPGDGRTKENGCGSGSGLAAGWVASEQAFLQLSAGAGMRDTG